jgi:hypothetical protein
MTRLTWNTSGTEYAETGLDRGVLYYSGNNLVPWNGLVSVDEAFDGGAGISSYYNGQKIVSITARREFKATIKAFTWPQQFNRCIGRHDIRPGVSITNQIRTPFSFSYRTRVGTNDYKIHMIYNATATPSDITYGSIGDSIDANLYQWSISTIPQSYTLAQAYKPTEYLIIDSRLVSSSVWTYFDTMFYGGQYRTPTLLYPSEIYAYLA